MPSKAGASAAIPSSPIWLPGSSARAGRAMKEAMNEGALKLAKGNSVGVRFCVCVRVRACVRVRVGVGVDADISAVVNIGGYERAC